MADWSIVEAREPRPGLVTSGVIQPEQLGELEANGIRTVVNLCPHGEIPWDEAAEVSGRGMRYVNIPVAGPADLTPENARELAAIANEPANQPVLVHCQSSNRVGALFALGHFLETGDAEAALQFGRETGLTRMEPIVQALISQHAADS